MNETVIEGPGAASSAECEAVLRSLPEWFGIEAALVQYAKDAAVLPTLTARAGGPLCGFLSVKRHFPGSAEIHCVAVHVAYRSRGIGRALLASCEAWLVGEGVRLLQVKTLGPSRSSEPYERTRRVYERAGFTPVEEFLTLWEGNPCLQLAKPLRPG